MRKTSFFSQKEKTLNNASLSYLPTSQTIKNNHTHTCNTEYSSHTFRSRASSFCPKLCIIGPLKSERKFPFSFFAATQLGIRFHFRLVLQCFTIMLTSTIAKCDRYSVQNLNDFFNLYVAKKGPIKSETVTK